MNTLPNCDHDECPPTGCRRAPGLGVASGSRFVWRGDLDDDCTCQVGDLAAHAECMDEIRWRSIDEKRYETAKVWYCSVGRVDERGFLVGEHLFHSGEPGGMILSGEMARAICEAIISANKPDQQ